MSQTTNRKRQIILALMRKGYDPVTAAQMADAQLRAEQSQGK